MCVFNEPRNFHNYPFFFQSHNYRFEYMLQTRNLNSAFYMLRNSASFSFQKKKKIKDGFQSSFHYFSFFLRSPLGDETLTVQSLIPTCSSAISLLLQDTVASPMLAQGVGGSPPHTGTSPTPLSTTAWRQEELSTAVLQYGRPRLA